MSGVRDAPAHAMKDCGAPQALPYAQSIDGSIFALGAGFGVLGLFFAVFVLYVTYSYIMVCGAALMNAIMAIFAVGPAMIHGKPRRRARRRLEQFFRHAFLVFVYVLYTCVAALLILKTVTPGGLASQVGMTSPVAMLVLVALWSAVATGVFWWLKKDLLHDTTRQDLVHSVKQAVHLGSSGYKRGQDAVTQGRVLSGRARERFSGSSGNDDDAAGQRSTHAPVAGRPAAGRPARRPTSQNMRPPNGPAQATRPPGMGTTTATRRAASAGGAAAGSAGVAGAAETGAAVLAPEVAIPAAVAVGAASKMRGRSSKSASSQRFPNFGSSAGGQRPNGTTQQRSAAPDGRRPGTSQLPAAPGSSAPRPQRQPVSRPTPDAAPPPVSGRNRS